MKNFNEDFVPSTVDEAINHLFDSLSDESKEHLKKGDFAHHGFGTGIRISWSLWEEGTPFKLDFKKRFNLWGMGDDCSGIIFEGVKAKVRGLDVEEQLNKTAERYRKHWVKHGVNPVTGERVPGFEENRTMKFKIDKDGNIEYL